MSPYKFRMLITSRSNFFTVTLIIIVEKKPKRLIASDRFSHNMSPDAWLGIRWTRFSMKQTFRKLHLTIFFNPIPTGSCHVTLIYGLIPPMAGRNRVKEKQTFCSQRHI